MRKLIYTAAILLGIGYAGAMWSAESTGKALSETEAALKGLSVATFAGGCFWCMEPLYDKLDGVLSTTSGYIGGEKVDPTYKEVSSGGTGHTEAMQVVYDPKKISYEKLLDLFWVNHDPTVADRQFCDRGTQYRPGIFFHNEEQKKLALESKDKIAMTKTFADDIVTEITPADTFYPAEDYHQDYYITNPLRYKYYRYACGRDARLEDLWGPSAGH